ncbi:PREDICTED: mediator of RNA polymerase II transcription subunit 28, partial [Pterocles gutturalis]|uniref:mediator of RNA polymerase II transcription subunit 28 n=1 Tax=Pterocles gutturalis TaxID=240206 RepID=UPI000528799F
WDAVHSGERLTGEETPSVTIGVLRKPLSAGWLRRLCGVALTCGVDQCIQKFLDVARQTECFFLQKRLQLSVQKPEQVIKEDVSELRNELQRKEALIQKHLSKLRHWQQVLEDISVQHKKPAEMPQGPLAYLEQASANIPAPMKQT